MGLIANVYRQVDIQNADGTATMVDCTNGGWSGRFNTVCIVNIKGPFKPSASIPAVMLIDGPGPDPNPIIVLEKHIQDKAWTQFGGNFVYTSDTRFGLAIDEIVGKHIAGVGVRIHDRIE
jgi:hypothetical protein